MIESLIPDLTVETPSFWRSNNGPARMLIPYPAWFLSDFDDYVQSELTEFVRRETQSVIFIRVSRKSMICVLTLRNGYDVRGESACLNPEHYDPAIGAKYALHNAVDKASAVIAYKEQDKFAAGQEPTYDTPAPKE